MSEEVRERNSWLLFIVIIILNFLDYWTTAVFIKAHGSFEVEANPLAYSLLVWYGSADILLIAKIIVLIIQTLVIFISFKRNLCNRALLQGAHIFVFVIYVGVVAMNLLLLRGLGL